MNIYRVGAFSQAGGNMTINDALATVDSLVPNTYDRSIKIKWLSTVEGLLLNNIFSKFQGIPSAARQYVDEGKYPSKVSADDIPGTAISFSGFDDKTSADTELLVPKEYDEIYIQWILAKIHYYNDETIKYNNAALAYDAMQSALRNQWAQTHMPMQTEMSFF